MRVATFNCNSVRQRIGLILAWLDEHRPDLLALQETKVTDEQFPADAFADAGWRVVYRGQKSYNGVALVSAEELANVSFGLGDGDDGESEPRLAAATLGDVHLINTYVPQGKALDSDAFAFKLDWFARLGRYIDERYDLERDKVLWMGDLNVAPTAADVHDSKKIWPHVCHCQKVIDAFESVRAFGFDDVFRQHLPEEGVFTFWDYRVRNALERNVGWRIDHLLASPPLAATSVACAVDRELRKQEKPSDHTVVFADFEPDY